LIRKSISIDSDVKVSPYLAHNIKFSTQKNLMVNSKRFLSFYDYAGIVVERSVSDNAAKYLMEFDGTCFIVNEFIGRVRELTKLGARVDVRFL
jgi:hypothetical protein